MTLQLSWNEFDVQLDPEAGKILDISDILHLEERYVYVIQTPKELPIGYQDGTSRVCYIGRSARGRDRKSRISAHSQGWIFRVMALSPELGPFRISYCHPRRQKKSDAYEDLEAYLLRIFREKFGSHPLFNKRSENEKGEYDVALNTNIFRRLSVEPRIRAFAIADDMAIEE